jgi:fructan beta-fructosidase
MGLPVELALRSTGSGASLRVNPVRELKSLRLTTHTIKPQTLAPGNNPLAEIHGDLLEIEAEIGIGTAKEIAFDLRGIPLVYNVAAQTISCLGCRASLLPKDGKISLHIFIDRASVDIFGSGGTLYLPTAERLAIQNQNLKLSSQGGDASIVSLEVYQLKSAWE